MKKHVALLLAILCALSTLPAQAEDHGLLQAIPDVLRPGKQYALHILSPTDGTLDLHLLDEGGERAYSIYLDYPVTAGDNVLPWDGLRNDGSAIAPGEYQLSAAIQDTLAQAPLRIGAPYPLLSRLRQSAATLDADPLVISLDASVSGRLDVLLRDDGGATTTAPVLQVAVTEGENSSTWDGTMDGARVADGAYRLILTLYAENGTESMPHLIPVEVVSGEASATPAAAAGDAIVFTAGPDMPSAPVSTAAPEPTPAALSQPYSSVQDGTFWAMPPGETDDAAIWAIMTQPITIYDGGMDQRDHIYLMENADGTGAKLAQIHAQSQGIHLLGEPNEHGYVYAEVFSSYDNYYFPETDEEKAHAFDVKQGYVKADGLKEVQVRQDMGLLIDKLTQRMYLFIDGQRVTEFLICTGLIEDEKYWNETTAGEFITVSHTGGFSSNKYMYCDMAIRINGGILLHEVPYEPLGDGSKRYTNFEKVLGQKASHGCIRIQRLPTPEGYNHQWLWDNFRPSAPYKVLIWDDLGRADTPAVWQPNP